MSKKGRPPVQRTPAEKKRLSYSRDCRNNYGENNKSSRKAIPLRRAMESRDERRKATQILAGVTRLDDEDVDLIESSIRQEIGRVGGWRKSSDLPLGKWVDQQAKALQHRSKQSRRKRNLAFMSPSENNT